jgi:hypothetical protein
MTSDTETTWMGESLAVQHQSVRDLPELPECGQNGWRFSKREQPGNVGKGQVAHRKALLDDSTLETVIYYRGRDTVFRVLRKGGIGTGNETYGPVRLCEKNLLGKPLLNGDGLLRCDLEAVRNGRNLQFPMTTRR